MIKFFRKIRQRLLSENKISKYLIYATGEIALVVIGILIALQLNNWNTDNKASIEEIELLKEMQFNLEKDLKDCIWNVNRNQDLLKSNSIVLQHLEERTPFHDSLKVHYANLLGTTTQLRNMSAYDNLKSKGINLIANDSLRQNITTVYSARYYYIEMKELEYDNQIQLNQVIPQLNGKVLINNILKTGYPINIEKLYLDNNLKGTLNTNINVKLFMINAYKNLEIDIQNLIEQIKKELENRKSRT
jgi:hypothetical protein